MAQGHPEPDHPHRLAPRFHDVHDQGVHRHDGGRRQSPRELLERQGGRAREPHRPGANGSLQGGPHEDHVPHHARCALARYLSQAPDQRRGRHQPLRVAVAAALRVAREGGRLLHRDCRRRVPLRFRVHRQRRASRDHAAHGPHLRHGHAGSEAVDGLRAGRPRRNRQDRDDQGLGRHAREVHLRVQLRAGDGLQVHGGHLEGAGGLGRVGLLRRVQPPYCRGAVGVLDAVQGHPRRDRGQEAHLRPGGCGAQAGFDGRRLHHHEPRVPRAHAAPGVSKGAFPTGNGGRARFRAHRREHAHGGGLQGGEAPRRQVHQPLHPLYRSPLQGYALRLGAPCHQVGAARGGRLQALGAGHFRGQDPVPLAPRLQPPEDCRRRPDRVHGAAGRPLPRHRRAAPARLGPREEG
mmetsp:Transcript_20358/g.49198  ORF Transcript_20358/g.49198 Transcript_20358/m.49198 type:complete len:407 (+) Transcript_20358:2368-3588(+)